MGIHGNPVEIFRIWWKSMESGGNPWNPLEINEILWKSMESNGNPWKSNGNLWNPVENHGIRWGLMLIAPAGHWMPVCWRVEKMPTLEHFCAAKMRKCKH